MAAMGVCSALWSLTVIENAHIGLRQASTTLRE